MKKFSIVLEQKKKEIESLELVNEGNLYLEFSKKYHKEHGVSGPFDKKFGGDKKKQSEYMEKLGKAWSEYKEKKGIKNKNGKFDFKKKINESKAIELASQMIGDGGDPNYHFVTMCDDYYFEKKGEMVKYSKDVQSSPLKIKTTPDMGKYVFGPFMNLEESKLFGESIELDEINGPRMVIIEDRKNGSVYSRFLSCKLQPVWDEHTEGKLDMTDIIDTEEGDSEEYEDPTTEYTYREEHEDE
jgi:hypothetical protein